MYKEYMKSIYSWLERCQVTDKGYDYGGILDPVDRSVKGEHYATTHFALLSALLFRTEGKEAYLDHCRKSLEFHLRTYPDGYNSKPEDYHWDFNNCAFLETYSLLKGYLGNEEEKKILSMLDRWKTGPQAGTNWLAMRAYSYLLKYRIRRKIRDFMQYKRFLIKVKQAQSKDGCFDDKPGRSRPLQYHAYTLAILHRIYMITKDSGLRKRFLKGVDFLKHFIDPDGDFNYYGRGQRQIFGYAAGLYVMESAKRLDRKNAGEYQMLTDRMIRFVRQHTRQSSLPNLVLNGFDDKEKVGWYDYHHLSVYGSFFGAWMGLCDSIKSRCAKAMKIDYKSGSFPDSGFLVHRNENYFCAFAKGGADYLTEASITPVHLWIKGMGPVVSCVGGPSRDKYGKTNIMKDAELNFFSPLVKAEGRWMPPSAGKMMEAGSNRFRLTYKHKLFSIKRNVTFHEKEIIFHDTVRLKRNLIPDGIRLFNMPVPERFNTCLKGNAMEIKGESGCLDVISDMEEIEKAERIKASHEKVNIFKITGDGRSETNTRLVIR